MSPYFTHCSSWASHTTHRQKLQPGSLVPTCLANCGAVFFITPLNTLRPRQNGYHFPDDIFKCIFLNEKVSFLINISLKYVPKCSSNNIPALVQIMVWCRPGNKPLSEPMMVSFPTHICVTRPQWVKCSFWWRYKLHSGLDHRIWWFLICTQSIRWYTRCMNTII